MYMIGLEGFPAVVMHGAILWDIELCGQYVNQYYRRRYYLHFQGRKCVE
jgi:hypothetical protein